MMTSRSLICLLENQNGGKLQKRPLYTCVRYFLLYLHYNLKIITGPRKLRTKNPDITNLIGKLWTNLGISSIADKTDLPRWFRWDGRG
jgi:hypothetical protein